MYGFCHQRAPGFQDVSWGAPEETLPEGPGFPGSLEASTDWEGVGMGMGMGLHRFWKPQQGLGQPGVLLGQMGTS